MVPRFNTRLRLWGVLLLVLAISPMTAPFSTFDPGLLFDESPPAADAILQAKPSTTDPVAALGTTVTFSVRLEADADRPPRTQDTLIVRLPLATPLRI